MPPTRRYKTPSKAVLQDLAARAKAGDQRAAEDLIRGNRGLMISKARQICGTRLSKDEIEAIGALACMEALRKYDPDRPGALFSGLLGFCLQQAFDEHMRAVMGVTTSAKSRLDKAVRERARAMLRTAQDEGMSPGEALAHVSKQLRVSDSDLAAHLNSAFGNALPSRSDGPHPDDPLMQLPADLPTPEETNTERQRAALLEELFAELTPRQENIARKRMYGFSLEEIAEDLGVSRQFVGNNWNKTLEQMRRWFDARGLELSDLL